MGTGAKVKQIREKQVCIFFLFKKSKFERLRTTQNLLLLQRLTRHNLHIARPHSVGAIQTTFLIIGYNKKALCFFVTDFLFAQPFDLTQFETHYKYRHFETVPQLYAFASLVV